MTAAQTEAWAIAQTSLWIPANPEHAKLGWTYDFEQMERISRAAYDNTGYDATMEVVEFVMAEADRRHRDALSAERAAHAETRRERDEALKALDEAEHGLIFAGADKEIADGHFVPAPTAALRIVRTARRALTGGNND